MKTIILASALILGTTSFFTANAAEKEIKKVNTLPAVSVADTLPVTIEANESLFITTNENSTEKVQYTPEQKAAIVGLEFRSTSR